MDNRAEIGRILADVGLRHWGVAAFADTLPLLECRAKSRLPQNAKSVIVCLLGYYAGERAHNISRYAWARDYHVLAEELLDPAVARMRAIWSAQEFSFFTDNSPIREVTAARLAGLGFVGNNGLLINPVYGTYHFIAEIVTDLWLEPSIPLESGCGECRRCLDACPAGALSPSGVDKSRCRSHITQKKGELTDWETEQVRKGGLAWGCDICNDVCPHNHPPCKTDLAVFCRDLRGMIQEEDLPQLVQERAFGYRGVKVLQRNLRIIKRKASGGGPDTGE
ncbi:MAG: DUF1730 domain-containing protein [Oscillospiraceae bacterium]|nr:DUF1730 domain-containing protein [Oscillospiraceae bacterium]